MPALIVASRLKEANHNDPCPINRQCAPEPRSFRRQAGPMSAVSITQRLARFMLRTRGAKRPHRWASNGGRLRQSCQRLHVPYRDGSPLGSFFVLGNRQEMIEKLVIIGNGMAPGRMLEHLLEAAPGRYQVTIFNAEPRVNYDRIMLSPVLSGRRTTSRSSSTVMAGTSATASPCTRGTGSRRSTASPGPSPPRRA